MKLLGIITRIDTLNKKKRTFVNQTYIEKIKAYGWMPLLLSEVNLAHLYSEICDALLVPGGYDMNSFYQDETLHPNCLIYDDPIDLLDFTIIEAFVSKQKPILGICRGLQILNVYFEGTIHQHMLSNHQISHEVTFLRSYIYPAQTKVIVNSYHHQCINRLGNGLLPLAIHNETIEAFIHETLPILAVQWHPELLDDDTILPYFLCKVATCRFSLKKRNKKNTTIANANKLK